MSVQKKDLEEFKNEIIHEFRMYTESLRSDIQQVAEGHQLLNDKVDRLQEGQDELTIRVDRLGLVTLKLEKGQKQLETSCRGLEKGQKQLEKGYNKLEKRFDNLEKELRDTRGDLSKRIDGVAIDLASHREDTEGHGKGYKVSDS